MPAIYASYVDTGSEISPITDISLIDTATLTNGARRQVAGVGIFKLDKDSRAAVTNYTSKVAKDGGRWLRDFTPSVVLSDSFNTIDVGQQVTRTGWVNSSGTATQNQSAIDVDTITATDANVQLLGQWLKGITEALEQVHVIGTTQI